MRISDWSSDVCSSDLIGDEPHHAVQDGGHVDGVARLVREPAGLERGQIEQVLNDAQQVAPALQDVAGLAAIALIAARAENLAGKDIREPDDGVEMGRTSCRERVFMDVRI